MGGFLFEQVVFGPVKSRRLGISLGLNLLPLNEKHCTFNCLYCECGWTTPGGERCHDYPTAAIIKDELEKKLTAIADRNSFIDAITFAGNGEPTIHPEFPQVMKDTVEIRDKYFPSAKIAVLSNGSMAGKEEIRQALLMADINMLKLDAGTDGTFQKLNNPVIAITLEEIVENYKEFHGNFTVQSLFAKVKHKGEIIDNTTGEELDSWIDKLKILRPKLVIIYPVARETPLEGVEKVSPAILQDIADRVMNEGLNVEIYN